jgi:hypothetical protein
MATLSEEVHEVWSMMNDALLECQDIRGLQDRVFQLERLVEEKTAAISRQQSDAAFRKAYANRKAEELETAAAEARAQLQAALTELSSVRELQKADTERAEAKQAMQLFDVREECRVQLNTASRLHQEALERLGQQHSHMLERASASWQERAEELASAHAADLRQLVRSNAEAIEREREVLRAQQNASIAGLRRQLDQDRSESAAVHRAELEALRDAHRSDMTRAQAEHSDAVRLLSDEMVAVQARLEARARAADDECQRLRKLLADEQHARTTSSELRDETITRMRHEFETQRRRYEQALLDHEHELSRVRVEAEQRTQASVDDARRETQQLRRELELQASEAAAHRTECERIRAEIGAALASAERSRVELANADGEWRLKHERLSSRHQIELEQVMREERKRLSDVAPPAPPSTHARKCRATSVRFVARIISLAAIGRPCGTSFTRCTFV